MLYFRPWQLRRSNWKPVAYSDSRGVRGTHDSFVLWEQAQWDFWEKEAKRDGRCRQALLEGWTAHQRNNVADTQEMTDIFP